MTDLSRKSYRKQLEKHNDPYWERITEGQYLGFRRSPKTPRETWLARYRGPDGRQQHHALGDATRAFDYDQAKEKALAWLSQISGSSVTTVKRGTIKAALQAYIDELRALNRADAAKAAEGIFKTAVYDDDLANIKLERATATQFSEWRERLKVGRMPRSVNRYVRSVVAGLNVAHEKGHTGKPSTWQLTPLTDDTADENETAVFLNPEQRNALLAASTPDAALFFRGLECTGARPKELAAATVSHFDGKNIRLAHKKGNPPKLRVRHTQLFNAEAVALFAELAKGRDDPTALLFTDAGRPWTRGRWAEEVRAAVKTHNQDAKRGDVRLPEKLGAYVFRHARISELLQVHRIDPLTVAKQTGTSVVMIEKAYYKFIPEKYRERLAEVKS